MSRLPTKFVITILAIGILVGAATTVTVMSAGVKPSNLAQAQLRFPFQTQPRAVVPMQQQPLATTSSGSGGGSFGPNCVGCVTAQNLANGAVTTQKIAPGAVSLTTEQIAGPVNSIPAGAGFTVAQVFCPAGTIVTGGGFSTSQGLLVSGSLKDGGENGWRASVSNPTSDTGEAQAFAVCATIQP